MFLQVAIESPLIVDQTQQPALVCICAERSYSPFGLNCALLLHQWLYF